MTTTNAIEKLIKQKLIECDLRQVDIANALKISRAAVAQYVSGKQSSRRFDAWIYCFLGLDLVALRADATARKKESLINNPGEVEHMIVQSDGYTK